MGRGLDHSRVAIQTSQFSQLLCPQFFLHHNTSTLQVLKSVESNSSPNGEWRKKVCKIEQTCHTDLHMLLEHKLKKKFHYKKRHLLNIFLKSKKKIIRDLQSVSSKQSKHSTSTRANRCFSNWFQNWAGCNYESWEHNRARVNQHPPRAPWWMDGKVHFHLVLGTLVLSPLTPC